MSTSNKATNEATQSDVSFANNYLKALNILFQSNRTERYPYIVDLGIELGPLSNLMGHATELACKVLLISHGFSNKKIKKFKGFRYVDNTRIAKQQFRRHNIFFLFRAANIYCLTKNDRARITDILSDHKYFKESVEIFLEPPDRPDFETYKNAIFALNRGHDSPFNDRYFQTGSRRLADPELIMIVAQYLLKKAERTITNRK